MGSVKGQWKIVGEYHDGSKQSSKVGKATGGKAITVQFQTQALIMYGPLQAYVNHL